MTETRAFQFANRARSTLLNGIAATDTSFVVQAGEGGRFPVLGVDEITAIILWDPSFQVFEIVYCTARAGDLLTIERAKEGTEAHAWAAGTIAVHNVTAAFFEQKITFHETFSLAGELVSGPKARLTLTASVPTAIHLEIHRSVNGGAYSLLTTVAPSTTTYDDSTVSGTNLYSYKFRLQRVDLTYTDFSNVVDIDAAFFDTFLLMHAEDTVYEVTGHATVSITGGGAVTTDQALFGAKSVFNPGTASESNNYIRLTGAIDDFVFPGEFTLEGWFYVKTYLGGYTNFVANNINFPGAGFIQLAVDPFGTFFFNSTLANVSGGLNRVPAGQWVHIALTRDASDQLRIFANGVLYGTSTAPGDVGGNNLGVSTIDLGRGQASDNDDMNGYVEEFRATKKCRYTANFTPPSAPFPPYP